MAFKLSKAQQSQKSELAMKLREKKQVLDDAVSEFNEKLEAIRDPVRQAVQEYIDVLAEARDFVEQVASDKRGEYDDKSDNWKEGDRGSAADDWIGYYEGADFSEPDIELPDDMSVDDLEDFDETLENLPDEADTV